MRLPVPAAGWPNRPRPGILRDALPEAPDSPEPVISLDMPITPGRCSAYPGLGLQSFPRQQPPVTCESERHVVLREGRGNSRRARPNICSAW